VSKFATEHSLWRYTIFSILLTLVAVAILSKGFYIMTVERDYWMKVDSLRMPRSVIVQPIRGNILAAGGQRLACNLPEYELHMDFVALKETINDKRNRLNPKRAWMRYLWQDKNGNDSEKLDSLCQGLHEIFPEKTAEEFKAHLKKGYDANQRFYPIVKKRVDYDTFLRVKQLPILCMRSGLSGFTYTEHMVRNRPYGSLASCVIGDVYKSSGKAFSGLELICDSVLRGRPGFQHSKKELNKWVSVVDSAAVDGCDVVTTIDVGFQDLAERALEKELRKDHAYTGVAIVMEVKTGDIKAMVNLDLNRETGQYYEHRNHALADFLEPGSVFKTASFLVALDDGKIDTTMKVDCNGGKREMYGVEMKDHNWTSGGYKEPLTVPQILQKSSNIGVSVLIDRAYHNRPEDFVAGLHRVGIGEDLKLKFIESKAPRIRYPERDKYGNWTKGWSDTALPWMSIGYETNVPPISVLTFYNAIANDGVMVRPRFVKSIMRGGETVEEYPVQVLRQSIVNHHDVLKQMQNMLREVVDYGLGKPAGSKSFSVAGKTGTAQKVGEKGYSTNGVTHYLLSFAGYFPADEPRYSCIVCIQKAGLPASGGQMSGKVFHDIAEGIMAKDIYYNAKGAHDMEYTRVPDTKSGNLQAADYVLTRLGFDVDGGWNGERSDGTPIWGTVNRDKKGVKLRRSKGRSMRQMPDVRGMGARDAVYAIENRGAKVRIKGCGKVIQQSKAAGSTIKKGEEITLYLS